MDGRHRKTLLVETKRCETQKKGRVDQRVGHRVEDEDKAGCVRFHEDENQRGRGTEEDAEQEEMWEDGRLSTGGTEKQDPEGECNDQGGGGGDQDGQD